MTGRTSWALQAGRRQGAAGCGGAETFWPVTVISPKLSRSLVSPVRPAALMSPELLSSWILPVSPEADRSPKASCSRISPVRPEASRSPELSESATVPLSALAFRLPNESSTVTGSPAGAVMPKLSEQLPIGASHWALRLRPPRSTGG